MMVLPKGMKEEEGMNIVSCLIGQLLLEMAGERGQNCDMVGYAIALEDDEHKRKLFQVCYDMETGDLGVKELPKDGPYVHGDLVFGVHGKEDAIVQAALHGDQFVDEPAGGLPIQSYCDVCGKQGSDFCRKDPAKCPYAEGR